MLLISIALPQPLKHIKVQSETMMLIKAKYDCDLQGNIYKA